MKSGGKSCSAMSWHFAFILFFLLRKMSWNFSKMGLIDWLPERIGIQKKEEFKLDLGEERDKWGRCGGVSFLPFVFFGGSSCFFAVWWVGTCCLGYGRWAGLGHEKKTKINKWDEAWGFYVGVAISQGVLFAPLTALYLRNITISFLKNVIAPILTKWK